MALPPLPVEVRDLALALNAPPRLIAHLTLVHAVAVTLTDRLSAVWPTLQYDRNAVLLGAATHDIGKVRYPQELSEPGHEHEAAGEALLRERGFDERIARCARTHGQWRQEAQPQLADLLVALADNLWKGQRDQALEEPITQMIALQCADAPWHVYMQLDDIADEISQVAPARLAWHNSYPV